MAVHITAADSVKGEPTHKSQWDAKHGGKVARENCAASTAQRTHHSSLSQLGLQIPKLYFSKPTGWLLSPTQ